MSPKELLYIEDALGQEKHLQTKCNETANRLSDADLKQFVSQMESKHQALFGSFYNLI